MARRGRTLELSDGSTVRIRAIEPADRELLTAGFERLSERSRYQRFFSPVHSLSEATLDYLTQIDHHDHEALVAVDEASGDLAGVARYVRVEDGVAEPAITVIDDWQGRGLSGELLRRLVARALEEDMHCFRAYVLYENPRAIEVLRRLGDTTSSAQGSTVQLDISLTEPEHADNAVREFMRGVADGALSPTLGLWRRLASQVRVSYEGRTEPWTGAGRLGESIVVGTDGSAQSTRAVRVAIELAKALDAPLHAVAAYRPLLESRLRADELLRSIEDDLRTADPDAQVHLRQGEAAEAIIAVAEDTRARTIVVGPGGGGARRYLVGSVADKVARHAPCDVLIAREGA